MSAGHSLRHGLFCIGLVGATFFALVSCNGPRATDLKIADKSAKPRLAVLVVIDQLRGDYPIRWKSLFKEGGFNRLASDGTWFQNCHYPYANTLTAAGHATCAAGCSPDVHGIIANDWYSVKEARKVYCVGTERYTQVPPPTKAKDKGKPASPDRLLAPTIADALKNATGGKGKVVALSLKDRSAVLPAGKSSPDAVYWASADGRFVTSTYYRDAAHDWVKAFNDSGFVDRWQGKMWRKSRPEIDYVRWAGLDDISGEALVNGQGRTFPHPFGAKNEDYYSAVANSPMGNEALLELARVAIDKEKLGQRDVPDLLVVSFSSNDLIGHTWGPDSQEVLDATLRADTTLRDLMRHLDDKVGKDKWVLALTADHGVCPLPEVSRARGEKARRVPFAQVAAGVEKQLDGLFADKGEKKGGKGWIVASGANMLYLNRGRIKARGVKQADVEKALATFLPADPRNGIQAAYTRAQLEGDIPKSDPIGRQLKRSYYAPESGDVAFVLKPLHLLNYAKGGTTHGTPHSYDTHVPLMVIGPGLKPGVRKDQPVSPEHAAVILAHGLGIKPPAKAAVDVPAGLFKK